MADELKDRKSDKQIITESDGQKKVVDTNKTGFSERDHGRKHDSPKFTDDNPRKKPIAGQ